MTKRAWQIGVIGHTGMVGHQVYSYFRKKGFAVWGLSRDPISPPGNATWEEINTNCNLIFVCVPTPFDFEKATADFSIVKTVLDQIKPGKIVIVKSTIWPGLTDKFQRKHPRIKLLFNPEFLSRTTAQRDFENPDRQLVGYTTKSRRIAPAILKVLPQGRYSKVVRAAEAELIKYAHNVYGSTQIIYANHLYEISKKLKIDYEEVKCGFAASEFIGPGILRYMAVLHHGGKRGFGGPCFPKDINSFLSFCESIGVPVEVPLAARDANRRILKSQKMDETAAEKQL